MVNNLAMEAAVTAVENELGIGGQPEAEDHQYLTSNTNQYVTVLSMIDGEPRPILKNDFSRVIRKRLEDGRPAFWVEGMPYEAPEYKRGNLMCFLHPDFDETDGPWGIDRKFLEDEVGLVGYTCNMQNTKNNNRADFKNVLMRTAHERSKHRAEYEATVDALERIQATADRAAQRDQMAAILELVKGNAAAVDAAAEPKKRGPGRPRKNED